MDESTQVSSLEPDSAEVADALRDLSAKLGDMQAEIHALRSQASSLPQAYSDAPGWGDRDARRRDALAWVHSVDTPIARRPTFPMLLLEIAFLAAVAVAAALADLETRVIVAIMAGAWILVALAEWTAARAARRRAQAAYAPLPFATAFPATDPSWFAPPVERAILEETGELTDTGELSETDLASEAPAKLPPPADP
jgi:septal ring factor EnvC (AmiA/AmiB activator)